MDYVGALLAHSQTMVTPLRRVTHRLGKKHALLWPELEFLHRRLPIAIVEPSRQALRRCKQADVCCNEPRGDIVVRLLDLRIADVAVRLPAPGVLTRQIRDKADIDRRGCRTPPASQSAKVPRDDRGQPVRHCLIYVDALGEGHVKIHFLGVTR